MIQSDCHILLAYSTALQAESQYEYYFRKLPIFLQEKISRYRSRTEQIASLAGLCLLVEGLKKSGKAPRHVGGLSYDKNNRPFLKDLPDLDFNISHSGKLAACAIAKHRRIGIDIENHQPINIYNLRAQLSPKQWDELENTENTQSLFYQYWVQKEALLKADGSGLSIPMSSIEIEGNRAIVRQQVWYLQELSLPIDYSGCLASDQPLETLVQWIDL